MNPSEIKSKTRYTTIKSIIDQCKELMKYDDGYEAMKLLVYYTEENGDTELNRYANNILKNYYGN